MSQTAVRDLLQIFRSCVSAVLPEKLIKQSVKYDHVDQILTVTNNRYNLRNKNIYLAGAGKAVQDMARTLEEILDSKLKNGIVSIPVGSLNCSIVKKVKYFEGAKNNLPDQNAVNTTVKIKEMATSLEKDDFLIVLLSGGGSALLSLPKPPLNLSQKTEFIKILAKGGADIKILNTARKMMSDIKGGQLAIAAQPAQVVSLIISDIVDDPIDLIASGPTVENTDDNCSKAMHILHDRLSEPSLKEMHFNLVEEIFSNIKAQPIPFPSDKVQNYIIGSNKLSIEAAIKEAGKLNYHPIALSNTITGDLEHVASQYELLTREICKVLEGKTDVKTAKSVLKQRPFFESINMDNIDDIAENRDVCLILGGEITVKVNGKGVGGRNQQLALKFSENMHTNKETLEKFHIYFLSAGTDGIDGPTDAAGAIGYPNLVEEAENENMNVKCYLSTNDSYNFYKKFQNGRYHIITGHTGTNVMDIHLIIIKHK